VERILAGVARFQDEVYPQGRRAFEDLAREQHPRALMVACSDSRVIPSLITQTEPGDMFVCRVVGAIVPPAGVAGAVAATVEYAVAVLGVDHVIVCAHSDCGAIRALLDPEALAGHDAIAGFLRHARPALAAVLARHPGASGERLLDLVTRAHVALQLEHLRTHPAVAARAADGSLALHGWVYDIETGAVSVLDEPTATLAPLPRPGTGSGPEPGPSELERPGVG
jgi:carbonic anhydrase